MGFPLFSPSILVFSPLFLVQHPYDSTELDMKNKQPPTPRGIELTGTVRWNTPEQVFDRFRQPNEVWWIMVKKSIHWNYQTSLKHHEEIWNKRYEHYEHHEQDMEKPSTTLEQFLIKFTMVWHIGSQREGMTVALRSYDCCLLVPCDDGHKNFGSCMFFLEADGSMRATGWDTRARVENEETRFRWEPHLAALLAALIQRIRNNLHRNNLPRLRKRSSFFHVRKDSLWKKTQMRSTISPWESYEQFENI